MFNLFADKTLPGFEIARLIREYPDKWFHDSGAYTLNAPEWPEIWIRNGAGFIRIYSGEFSNREFTRAEKRAIHAAYQFWLKHNQDKSNGAFQSKIINLRARLAAPDTINPDSPKGPKP